jgi:hypothetical protein
MHDHAPQLTGCQVLPPLRLPGEAAAVPAATSNPGRPADEPRHGQAAQRFGMINAFVDVTLAELSRNEIAVWLILWRDARNGVARTSQADLARRAGVADRTVRRALTTLQQRGLVGVSSRGGLGRGPSSYRLVATSSPK